MTQMRQWLVASWVAAASFGASGASPDPDVAVPDADIVVSVVKKGAEIVVEVDCPVRAPLNVAWAVMTDYEHMSRFVSNIQFSAVEARNGNVLEVRQRGKVTRGLLSFSFETLREVALLPGKEIRSRLLEGDMKASAFTTRFVETDGVVHIIHSGRYTPTMWVPPVIGPSLVEAETRKQYGEFRAEILRRSG